MANLSIANFEKQVVAGDIEDAIKTLTGILLGLEAGRISMITDGSEAREAFRRQGYTRLAAAISTMICNPAFVVEPGRFEWLMMNKRTISAIFGATTYGSMENIISMCSDLGEDRLLFSSESNIYKCLVAWMLESPPVSVLGELLPQIPPTPRVLVWLSLFDRDYHLTAEVEQLRREALGLGHLVQDLAIPEQFLVRLSNTWMFCSYTNDSEKHQIKKTLNSIMRNTLRTIGVKQPPIYGRSKRDKKPKLAVLAEAFTHAHAMYRCYADAIRQLGSKFHLVLVAMDDRVDDISKSLFDEVVTFDTNSTIKDVIGKIVKLKADVIFYPSLGMHIWTVAACQLRLAPIQMMTIGHPATSMSEQVDYVLVPEHLMGDPDCFSETVVLMGKDSIPFTPHPETDSLPKPERKIATELVKIAVPSKGYKLHAKFLECCEEISRRAQCDVEFHFFPNMGEAQLLQVSARLERRLRSKFYSSTSYKEYMEQVGQCDIQLSPFPFGNTNGYVDGLIMGLPIVSMDGAEVHSRIDNALGAMAGIPDFCMTETPEEYVDAVVRLIDNQDERLHVAESIRNLDIEDIFFARDSSSSFLEAFTWIYDHHEDIQSDARHMWTVEDRVTIEHSEQASR